MSAADATSPAALRRSWVAELVGRPRAWALAMALLGGVPLASGLIRPPPPRVPLAGARPSFALADERQRPFTEAQLAGRVWAVAFVDPACVGCAARVADAARALERRTRNLWPMFGLLTVALAPTLPREGPAPVTWRLLGGEGAGALAEALAQGDEPERRRLAQGRRLAVLDAHGRLRTLYDNDAIGLDRLLHDVSLLANRGD